MGTRIRVNPGHLFELFCEIGIPSNCNESPHIIWKSPSNFKNEETLKCLPQFAYPVEFTDTAVHHFSFVFTNVDSKWTFGFCRHAPSFPACFVILSYLPWHETFYRILNHAAELSNREKPASSVQLQLFLDSLYKAKIPDPGLELCVSYEDKKFSVLCPDHNKLPSIPESRNMTEYFNAIDSTNMMTIFASMLHERRILVLSKKLSRLSACVQAANALIYPMHWQHIFIPVLPTHLVDYLSAPMPFLIGIPSSTFSRMKPSDIGDVVLLDADNNTVESPYADLDALPTEVLQSLRHDLKNPQNMLGDCVARAFLRASVKLIGGYWNALKLKPGEKISFNAEMFLQTRPAPMQPFLAKILQLQIFQQFIESRLKMLNSGQGVCDEFEFELTAHEDKGSTRLRNQYKDWVSYMKKEGGAFFKNMKKQVKVTGKKAYKDLRSRIHEMHHHKIIEDNGVPVNHKRSSRSPSALVNGLNLMGTSSKSVIPKEQSPLQLKSEPKDLTPSKTSADSEVDRSSLSDSSLLTFKPIDMDLMGDLHDFLFRRCSLCGDSSQGKTSISDPQLIDFNDGDKCSDCLSRRQSSDQAISKFEDSPHPLLPKPPKSRSPMRNTNLCSLRSSLNSSLSVDEPLIWLDGEDLNARRSNNNVFLSPTEENGNFNYLSPKNTNPFKNGPCNVIVQNSNLPPKIKSTNPFLETSDQDHMPYPLNKSFSGVSVKKMVNHWQTSNSTSNCNMLSSMGKKTSSPEVTPYRSQPLARTTSTPPGAFVALAKNPFLLSSELPKCIKENHVPQKSNNSSWENFQ